MKGTTRRVGQDRVTKRRPHQIRTVAIALSAAPNVDAAERDIENISQCMLDNIRRVSRRSITKRRADGDNEAGRSRSAVASAANFNRRP